MSIQKILRHVSERSLVCNIKVILQTPRSHINTQPQLNSLYEPDYLDSLKPKVPLYDTLNIQIKGYDFTILENYQKFIHSIAETMDVDVEDGWATPPMQLHIQKFKPLSLIIDAEFKMTVFERNIQVVDLASIVAPILLQVLQTTLPEGVHLKVHSHEPDHEEIRYVPDRELLELKTQLDTLGGPSTKKK